jgi:hypothetical protein
MRSAESDRQVLIFLPISVARDRREIALYPFSSKFLSAISRML